MALLGERTFATAVTNPDRADAGPDGGDQRPPIRCDRDAFLLCRTGRDLLDSPIAELLPPQVKGAADVGAEIHPPTIRRPRCRRAACAGRPHLVASRAAIERHQ